jgi:hypothetical protein
MTDRHPARAGDPPSRAMLLSRLPRPELDLEDSDDDDVRRIELRRAALEIAEIDHPAEITLTLAAAARYRKRDAT